MKRKHMIAGAITVAALAGGTAGAVAATNDDKAAEQTVLNDAAKSLGVSATDLRKALASAEDAQLDAAVKAGRLTRAQADEIKAHRKAEGTVLGRGGDGRGPGDHGGPRGGRFLITDAAKAIGISERSLFTQLRAGKTLTAIAKAKGKTLAEVKAAVKQSVTARLDADLKAGRITQAQRDEQVGELDEEIGRLGDFGKFGPGGFGGHDGPRPGDEDNDGSSSTS